MFATSCDDSTDEGVVDDTIVDDGTDDNSDGNDDVVDDGTIVGTWYTSEETVDDGIKIVAITFDSDGTYSEDLTAYDSEGDVIEDDCDYDTGNYTYDSETSVLIIYFDAGADAVSTLTATISDGMLTIKMAGDDGYTINLTKDVISPPTGEDNDQVSSGLVKSLTMTEDDEAGIITFSYDDNGTMNYVSSNDGLYWDLSYDGSSALTLTESKTSGDYVTNATLNSSGAVATTSFSRDYDDNTSIVEDRTYTYDNSGYLISIYEVEKWNSDDYTCFVKYEFAWESGNMTSVTKSSCTAYSAPSESDYEKSLKYTFTYNSYLNDLNIDITMLFVGLEDSPIDWDKGLLGTATKNMLSGFTEVTYSDDSTPSHYQQLVLDNFTYNSGVLTSFDYNFGSADSEDELDLTEYANVILTYYE